MNQALEQIVVAFTGFAVASLAIIIGMMGKSIVAFINTQREKVISQIGIEEYNRRRDIAYDVWNIVEEHFRLNDLYRTIDDKANMFTDVILERIPSLTEADIDYLRQAVAGQINAFKKSPLGEANEQ